MREGIHPDYYQAKVTCNCGNEFVTGSTNKEIHTEICSKCHPFYTGKKKMIDSTGRVDRFKKMTEKSKAKKTAVKKSKVEKKEEKTKNKAKK